MISEPSLPLAMLHPPPHPHTCQPTRDLSLHPHPPDTCPAVTQRDMSPPRLSTCPLPPPTPSPAALCGTSRLQDGWTPPGDIMLN